MDKYETGGSPKNQRFNNEMHLNPLKELGIANIVSQPIDSTKRLEIKPSLGDFKFNFCRKMRKLEKNDEGD